MATKTCRKCNMELDASKFSACKKNKDGLSSYCKVCATVAAIMSRDKDKQERHSFKAKWEKNKKFWKTLICPDCGRTFECSVWQNNGTRCRECQEVRQKVVAVAWQEKHRSIREQIREQKIKEWREPVIVPDVDPNNCAALWAAVIATAKTDARNKHYKKGQGEGDPREFLQSEYFAYILEMIGIDQDLAEKVRRHNAGNRAYLPRLGQRKVGGRQGLQAPARN